MEAPNTEREERTSSVCDEDVWRNQQRSEQPSTSEKQFVSIYSNVNHDSFL